MTDQATDMHPILALWAHPRSLSTVTEKIMRQRGDMTVFHEPFMADYYTHRAPRKFAMLETGGETWVDYPVMRDRIVRAAQSRAVFFKDMSYYALARLPGDPGFCKRCKSIFLIRDPRRAIASYWKKDPDFSQEEVGLEAQWRHVEHLNELGVEPIVIHAKTLAADPRATLSKVWDWADLPFIEAFEWDAGETPKGWDHVAGWHPEVIGSTGLKTDDRDPDDIFEKVARDAPHLHEYLAHHQPFYDRLAALAL